MDTSTERKKFWRKEIKHRIVESFGEKCCACGKSFEDCCYDLHHLNPEEKEFNLSSGNYNGAKSWLRIRDELKKCVLLCANCHRLVHNGFIEIQSPIYFNQEYYEWDLTKYNMIDYNLQPIDANYVCPICGGKKSSQAIYCANCSSHKPIFEVEREELKNMIYTLPMTEVGRRFGVSDNAIRKRCIKFNLPSKKSEIKKFSKEEWSKI